MLLIIFTRIGLVSRAGDLGVKTREFLSREIGVWAQKLVFGPTIF